MVDRDKVKEIIKKKFKDIEKIEIVRGKFKPDELVETHYPKPVKRHYMVYESFGQSVEELYFWFKDYLVDFGFADVEKIVDTFTASEQSAFFGSAQQRLGAQQNIASQYMATIGKMVKEMFQIVRDIQLLDEREKLYDLASGKTTGTPDDGAEKSLKGLWIDFVDNGPQGLKASSVYGLASQVGYATLPIIFFDAPAGLKLENVSKYVDKLEFNKDVKSVLVRKLEQYTAWRDATDKQIKAKKKFTISYLRQHYNAIKLYVDWVKPYLRNIKRLGMDPETQMSADIVGAFEGSVVEVEFLAKMPAEKPGYPRSCILVHFYFRTRPVMNTGQDYQRGPTHIGRAEMTFRGYVWTDKEVADYKKVRMAEDFELLKSIDSSIESSMDFLEEDLRKYLGEYEEKFGEDEERYRLAKNLVDTGASPNMDSAREKVKEMFSDKSKKPFGPIGDIVSGFKGAAKSFIPGRGKSDIKLAREIEEKRKDMAKGNAKLTSLIYTIFKKARGLMTP